MKLIASIDSVGYSDLYMTLSMVLFEAKKPNLNNVAVSENFAKEIVDNPSKYCGIGLYVDTDSLFEGEKLTHLYNERTDSFSTVMVGSFIGFDLDYSREYPTVIGTARIPKRDKEICDRIIELYKDGSLKCSFEISVAEYETLDDGTLWIDVNDNNYLTSMCLVSSPACEAAIALNLVAECKIESAMVAEHDVENNTTEESNNMIPDVFKPDENLPIEKSEDIVDKLVPHVPDSNPDIAPVETAEETDTAVENKVEDVGAPEETNNSSEETTETAEEETAGCKKSEEENAGCCKKSECDDPDECEDPDDCEEAECKKNAEETAELKATIAELQKQIAELKTKIAEHETAIAEVKTSKINAEALNPFMDSEPQVKKSGIFENPTFNNKWTLFD